MDDDARAREGLSGAQEKMTRPVGLAAPTGQDESAAFVRHMDVEPRLIRPSAPVPDAPDPAPERDRIEGELGIDALASSLEAYGAPPIAPLAGHTDRDALERELLEAAAADISRWNVRARRALHGEVREQASREAQAQDERLATEQEELQQELDARWSELQVLCDRAEHEVDRWVTEETHRRETARVEQQAALDSEWQRLIDADPDSVTATLRAAFPDDATTVLGFLDGVAVLVVACPDRDAVIADTEQAVTSAGRPVVRARPETRRNYLYLSAIASRVLAAVGRTLSTTPAVEAVTCVAVRACEAGDRPWEPIYVGTFEREYAERLLSRGRWSPDPDALAKAVGEAEDVELELARKTREIAALDLSADAGLAAVMEQMDPAVRSDEIAARSSDREAVRMFLDYGDTEHDNDKGGDDAAGLTREADTAHKSRTRPEPTPDERSADGFMPSEGGADPRHDGDPLPEAVKDSDGSVRRAAVQAIGRRNDQADTPLLLEALSDRDDTVRLEALYALKDRLSPDMRRDALIRACSDSDDIARRNALEALAELGDERDTPLLAEALKDPDDKVRLEAIYALKYRLAPQLRDALIRACSDVDASVRRKAFEALTELGDERDTPLLLKALKDSDASVRLEAIYALEGRSTLGSSSRLSEPLSEAMKDEDATVRHAAVRLFSRLEQPGAATRST